MTVVCRSGTLSDMKTLELDIAIRRLEEELKALRLAKAVLARLSAGDGASQEEEPEADEEEAEVDSESPTHWTRFALSVLGKAQGDGFTLAQLMNILAENGMPQKRDTVAKFLLRQKDKKVISPLKGFYKLKENA